MTLGDVLEAAARRRLTLVHHASDRGDLAAQLESWPVDVSFRRLPAGGPAPFVTVSENGDFRAAVRVDDLREWFHPAVRVPEPGETVSDAERALFELLDDTRFESLNRRQLLATSREIEDRAWRTGRGTLHAGFQSPAAFDAQRSLYRRFGADTALDVHVYVTPSRGSPDLTEEPFTVHESQHPDVGRYWFLAFDGGGADQQCALVAEQTGTSAYRGVWTYDPELVDAVLRAVEDVRARQSASG